MVQIKQGPLTAEELMELWRSVTDKEYNQPLTEKEGSNIEAIEQAAEQFARVSLQIDRNTQGMFILPWSGQTQPPSSGPARARTTLTVTRTGLYDQALYFTAGEVIVQHRMNDYGPEGGVDITTNREYVVEVANGFLPGDPGPIELQVVAVNDGPGYNFPTPDTLRTILQPGVRFSNTAATVENGAGNTHRVIATTFPDVPITRHIGQYLLFTSGANTGRYARVVGVENPNPAVPHGGVFNVAAEAIIRISGVVGTFNPGERVEQPLSGAEGDVLLVSGNRMLLQRRNGTFTTDPIQGEFGATANVDAKEQNENLVPEANAAGWLIVDWAEDLLVSVTNEEQPTGGKCGFLDELGNERGIQRGVGEGDEEYRKRVATPADVVSPGAVIRAGNGVLEPFGAEVCLREVGRPLFQGMFYDGDPSSDPFAYDLDLVEMTMIGGNLAGSNFAFYDEGPNGFFDDPAPQTNLNFFSVGTVSLPGLPFVPTSFIDGERVVSIDSNGIITTGNAQFDYIGPNQVQKVFRGVVNVRGPGFEVGRELVGLTSGFVQVMAAVGPGLRPEHRFNVWLNLREFRGFFLVGVPRAALDDFGVFYDAGGSNAFDATTLDNFYDGAAIGTNSVYSRIWNAVNSVRPAGVPFDLYIEDIGCI